MTGNGRFVCNGSAEIVHIAFTAEKGAKIAILKNEHECVELEFDGAYLVVTRSSLTDKADERVLRTKANDANAAMSFRLYRKNTIETLFEQLDGAVSNVCVSELEAPEITGDGTAKRLGKLTSDARCAVFACSRFAAKCASATVCFTESGAHKNIGRKKNAAEAIEQLRRQILFNGIK